MVVPQTQKAVTLRTAAPILAQKDGAADTSIALATGSIRAILKWFEADEQKTP
jgi:hypothetical protein